MKMTEIRNVNLYLKPELRADYRKLAKFEMSDGLTWSAILKWMVKAGAAEMKGVKDEDFKKELLADPQGRLVREYMKKLTKGKMK